MYTGNVMLSFADPIATRGWPLVNNIHLNAQYLPSEAGRLLGNATFTYDIHVSTQTNGYATPHLTVVDGTGRIVDPTEPGMFSSLTPITNGYLLSNAGPPEAIQQAGDFRYTFDSAGRLYQLTDPNGNVQQMSYPAGGGVIATDISTGKAISLSPVSGGVSVSVTENGVHTATINKNASGLVASIVWYTGSNSPMARVDFTYDSTQTAWYGISLLRTATKDNVAASTITYTATSMNSTNGGGHVPFFNQNQEGPNRDLRTQYLWDQPAPPGVAQRVKSTNNKGGIVYYDFNDQGDVIAVTNGTSLTGASAPTVQSVGYDSQRNVTSTSTNGTHTWIANYNLGLPTLVRDPLNNTWNFNWQANGTGAAAVDIASIVDPLSTVLHPLVTVNYDYTGIPGPNNNWLNWSLPHFASRAVDGGGNTWSAMPNQQGQVVNLFGPSPGNDGFNINYYGLPDTGMPQAVTDSAGNSLTFDAIGSLVPYDALNDPTTWSTHPGNPWGSGSAAQQTYQCLWDPLQRPNQLTRPDGHTFSWFYNGLTLDHTVDEQLTRVNYLFCPICGGLENISLPNSNPLWSLSWVDDDDGDLAAFTNARNYATSYGYGPLRELATVTYPDHVAGTHNDQLQLFYDNFGRVRQFKDARGDTFNFTWDDADRLLSLSGAASLAYTYWPDNSLNTATNGLGTITVTPDVVTRQPQTVTYDYRAGGLPDIQTIQYQYNPDGSRLSMTWWNGNQQVGTWSYLWAGAGQVSRVTNSYGEYSQWYYEGDGKIDWQYNTNGTWNFMGYTTGGYTNNGRDWPVTVASYSNYYAKYFAVDRLLYDNQATGGTVGKLTTVKRLDNTQVQFGYDSLYRLRTETSSGPMAYAPRTYNLDLAGNRLATDSGTSLGYNSADILTTVGGLTSGVTSDLDGNVTALPNRGMTPHSITWNALGQAISIDGATFGYDAFGHRAFQQLPGKPATFFIYDGDLLLGEVQPPSGSTGGGTGGTGGQLGALTVIDPDSTPVWDETVPPDSSDNPPPLPPGAPGAPGSAAPVTGTSTSTVGVVYTWGAAGLISERRYPGQPGAYTMWHHYGPQGETRYLTDSIGRRTLPYNYTSYGVLLATPGGPSPFQFGGQVGYYTYPNGLVLCGARWYDPEIGRWLSRDPIGYQGGPNLFEYCGGNPVGRLDRRGMDDTTIWGQLCHWDTWSAGLGTGGAVVADTFTFGAFDSSPWKNQPGYEGSAFCASISREAVLQITGSGVLRMAAKAREAGTAAKFLNWYNKGSEFDGVWWKLSTKDKFFYEIGQKTLGEARYAKYGGMFAEASPVEAAVARGKVLWGQGPMKALFPESTGFLRGGTGGTLFTGPTPIFRAGAKSVGAALPFGAGWYEMGRR